MNLVIKSSDFKHIDSKSQYNHNYYEYVGKEATHSFELYEICHEDYNFCEYWIVGTDNKVFLGCSSDYIHGNAIVNISFREYFT